MSNIIDFEDKDKSLNDGIRNKFRDIDANQIKRVVNLKSDLSTLYTSFNPILSFDTNKIYSVVSDGNISFSLSATTQNIVGNEILYSLNVTGTSNISFSSDFTVIDNNIPINGDYVLKFKYISSDNVLTTLYKSVITGSSSNTNLIKQVLNFIDTGTTFYFTQGDNYQITSVDTQSGVTYTIKLSDEVTNYNLGDTVLAWDELLITTNIAGAIRLNGSLI